MSYMIAGGSNIKRKQKESTHYYGKIKNIMPYSIELSVPAKYFYDNKYGKEDSVSISTGGVSVIVKKIHQHLQKIGVMQYVKLWVKSEVYSGGNSIHVYFDRAGDETLKLSKKIMECFQTGNFNPMIDLYEYKKKDKRPYLELKNGQKVELSTKYNFVDKKPPYGTKEYYECLKR